MRGIIAQYIQHAADEGEVNATGNLQSLQASLEEICEVGNDEECEWAAHLLKRVNKAIVIINETVLVEIARQHPVGSHEFNEHYLRIWESGKF